MVSKKERNNNVPPTTPEVKEKKPRKKKKTELENLEIKMKNWSSSKLTELAWRKYFSKTRMHFLGPVTLSEIQDADLSPANNSCVLDTHIKDTLEEDMFDDATVWVGEEDKKSWEEELMLGYQGIGSGEQVEADG